MAALAKGSFSSVFVPHCRQPESDLRSSQVLPSASSSAAALALDLTAIRSFSFYPPYIMLDDLSRAPLCSPTATRTRGSSSTILSSTSQEAATPTSSTNSPSSLILSASPFDPCPSLPLLPLFESSGPRSWTASPSAPGPASAPSTYITPSSLPAVSISTVLTDWE